MLRGELVTVCHGLQIHRRYDWDYTFCGIGKVDNNKQSSRPLCKTCERLWKIYCRENKVKEE